MTVVKRIYSAIARKDDKIFKGIEEINLLQELDFRSVWTKDISDNTRENIWKYLQTLVVIGKKIIGDDDEIDQLLEKFSSTGEEAAPLGEQEEMLDMLKNMST